MTDRALTLAMVYAGWSEPNIRCELFLRNLQRPVLRFRIEGVSPFTEALWLSVGAIAVVLFWVGVVYAAVNWL